MTAPAGSYTRTLLRVVAHLVAEVPFFVVASIQISKGWLPTSDDAVIAWRTWSVFTGPGPVPLTGQFSQITAAGGHTAFDLGPLQYFLLAIPVRIDPVHGILWGAAVLAALLAALSIEAMWSACGPLGGVCTSLALALTVTTLFEATVNLAWNPSTGVYAMFATMASCVAVGCGRKGWLAVAVGAGSLAAQCHTSFAVPVVAAVAIGIGMGVTRTRRGWLGPVVAAVVTGTACWIAPLIQQITGHPGNWSVVLSSVGRHGRTVGLDFGLRGIASATRLLPSWWLRVPALNTVARSTPFEKLLYDGSATWGVAALAICAAIAVAAALVQRPRLAAIAAIGAGTGVAAAWTLGSVPLAQAPYLVYYLYFVLWPVGMMISAALVGGVGALGIEAWRLLTSGRGEHSQREAQPQPQPERRAHSQRQRSPGLLLPNALVSGVLALALAASGLALAVVDVPLGSSSLYLLGWLPVNQARTATALALPILREHDEPGDRRPFDVEASPDFIIFRSAVTEAVAYLLAVKGYPARVSGNADSPLGAPYRASAKDAELFIKLGPHGKVEVQWLR